MTADLTFSFSARLWEPQVEPSWVFITVPDDQSDEISEAAPKRNGFGSVKVTVRIGATSWDTSLFPSKQAAAYVLPVKRAVRDREGLDVGDTAEVSIVVRPDA